MHAHHTVFWYLFTQFVLDKLTLKWAMTLGNCVGNGEQSVAGLWLTSYVGCLPSKQVICSCYRPWGTSGVEYLIIIVILAHSLRLWWLNLLFCFLFFCSSFTAYCCICAIFVVHELLIYYVSTVITWFTHTGYSVASLHDFLLYYCSFCGAAITLL